MDEFNIYLYIHDVIVGFLLFTDSAFLLLLNGEEEEKKHYNNN